MFRQDSSAPPVSHTTASITHRENQNTTQGNKTSGVFEGHQNFESSPPPRAPKREVNQQPQDDQGKGRRHISLPPPPPSRSTNQQRSNRDSKQPTTGPWLQDYAPKGKRHQRCRHRSIRGRILGFRPKHTKNGRRSFTMTPSRREAAPEGSTIIVADKVNSRPSLEASHLGPHRRAQVVESG